MTTVKLDPTAKISLFFFVLLSLFSIGYCIKCFQCNSAVDPGCGDLTSNDTNSRFYKDCKGNYENQSPFCRKVFTKVLDVENSDRVTRSCGWILKDNTTRKDHCQKGDTDFMKLRSCWCFSDSCNGSDKRSVSINVLVTTFLVFTFIYF